MSRFKIINLLDKLFVSTCIFLIIYAWINFYIRSLWTTFFLSLIFSFAVIFVLYYFLDKKQERIKESKQKSSLIEKYHLGFRLLTRDQKIELLKNAFSTKYDTIVNNDLIYNKDNKRYHIIIGNEYDKLTQNDLYSMLELVANLDVDEYIIICNSYTNIKTNIIKNRSIKLIDKEDLFKLYNDTNIFPDVSNINDSINKFSWKDFLQKMFTKEKARSYFFAGFILIFSSIILPYHIYYLVFGSTLLIFALLC